MMRLPGSALPVLIVLGLAGCAQMLSWEPDAYIVQPGDTLYQIAWRYSLDYRDLADWNELGRGNLIHPGQKIRLTAPEGWTRRPASAPTPARSSTTRSASSGTDRRSPPPTRTASPPPSAWRWPADGSLTGRFGSGSAGGNGINISGRLGQPVVAAAGGHVVYSGSGLIGYGQLIIVKHNDTYLSAYGHNRELRVTEGERVSAGQTIALMGQGPGRQPVLHFEIRRNGKPVDPLRYLPAR
jgi:lipoprotein NlpD